MGPVVVDEQRGRRVQLDQNRRIPTIRYGVRVDVLDKLGRQEKATLERLVIASVVVAHALRPPAGVLAYGHLVCAVENRTARMSACVPRSRRAPIYRLIRLVPSC